MDNTHTYIYYPFQSTCWTIEKVIQTKRVDFPTLFSYNILLRFPNFFLFLIVEVNYTYTTDTSPNITKASIRFIFE